MLLVLCRGHYACGHICLVLPVRALLSHLSGDVLSPKLSRDQPDLPPYKGELGVESSAQLHGKHTVLSEVGPIWNNELALVQLGRTRP